MLGITQAVTGSIYSLAFERNIFQLVNWSQAILPVIILGVTASFAAQTLQIISQKYTNTVTTGLILMTESLFSSLISVFFGVEQLTKQLVIGGTLIMIALVVIQFNLEWLKNIFDHKNIK
jgi:drug/metabolite transporter (DMT)-like permease